MTSEFPGNSQRPRPVKPEKAERREKAEQVVQGEVVRRRKPLSKRLSEIFVGQSPRNVFEFVALDVLVPAAKDTIADAVSQGFERLIFGDARSSSRRPGGYRPSGGHINYSRYSGGSSGTSSALSRKEEPRYEMSRRGRTNHDFDEIIVSTRVEAEEVIDRLLEITDRYGSSTVGDLFDLIGVDGNGYTDEKWGWRDLREAGVQRVRNGYLLALPRPESLD